jgi:hypothetical protein
MTAGSARRLQELAASGGEKFSANSPVSLTTPKGNDENVA